jgi:hypothetical protein
MRACTSFTNPIQILFFTFNFLKIMQTDFIPNADGNLDTWEQNFLTSFTSLAPNLGFSAAEVTAITTEITGHRTAYATSVTKQAESKAAVEIARTKRKAVIKTIRTVAKRINASPACTEAMRITLKIKGAEHTVDIAMLKPSLTATYNGSAVSVKFNKPAPVDAIRVYSKRGSETEFTFMNTFTKSPFADSRPRLDANTPETRQYRTRFLDSDVEIGVMSDVVEVIV